MSARGTGNPVQRRVRGCAERPVDRREPDAVRRTHAFLAGIFGEETYLASGKTFAGANWQARIAGVVALSPRL
jgi:hypothetical protein